MQCYIFLDDAQNTAQVLEKLVRGSKVSAKIPPTTYLYEYNSAFSHRMEAVHCSFVAATGSSHTNNT